jgi:hypothetical protein
MTKPVLEIFLFSIAVMGLLLIQGCYYDIDEELYPGNVNCDTSMVTYSLSVKPIINTYCNVCHNQIVAQGNVILDDYQSLKIYADSGRLLGAIKHLDGYFAMPQDASKLSPCNIAKIELWIEAGTLNN